MALTNGFRAKAAAVGLGLASVVAPAAMADEQPQQYASVDTSQANPALITASSTTAAPLVAPAAGSRAVRWAAETDGVGVSVKLGTNSHFTATDIQEILTRDFVAAGEPNLRFFFEQNDIPSTGVTYHYGVTGGASDGPFILNDSQAAIQSAVDQNHFYEERPELGL